MYAGSTVVLLLRPEPCRLPRTCYVARRRTAVSSDHEDPRRTRRRVLVQTISSSCVFVSFVSSWLHCWSQRLPMPALAHVPRAFSRSLLASLLLELRRRAAAPRASLPFAHAFQNLDEPEVDLTLLHVHADDLHLHLVPEAIDLVRVLAAQQMRALDETVVIVRHRRHVNQAFDEMLD